MLLKRTFFIVGAILAWGASLEAGISVGYFTDGTDSNGDSQVLDTGLAAPILSNGLTPVQITDIVAFVTAGNLSNISILMIDEINVSGRSPSAALLSQSTALSNWVLGGGVIAIHDRNVCQVGATCTPVPGSAGVSFTSLGGSNINVETSSTLVTNGPFGVITNATLDGGASSDNGFVLLGTLPSGALGILNNGTAGHEVALSYRFGSGWVYYSTIPLDFYVNVANIANFNPQPVTFRTIYAPNMVAYLNCLATGACSPTTPTTPVATAAPTLSGLGLGILAILLMGCAAVMLRSGQAKTPGAGSWPAVEP
jgi:hypothetical protein